MSLPKVSLGADWLSHWQPHSYTRGKLDAEGCDSGPGCGYFLVSQCHPDGGLEVFYQDGVLTLFCESCQRLVCRILVAGDA